MCRDLSFLFCLPSFTAGSPAASGRLDLGPSVLATCVLEKETLRVFYDNGDDYPVPLQFPVKRYVLFYSTVVDFIVPCYTYSLVIT